MCSIPSLMDGPALSRSSRVSSSISPSEGRKQYGFEEDTGLDSGPATEAKGSKF